MRERSGRRCADRSGIASWGRAAWRGPLWRRDAEQRNRAMMIPEIAFHRPGTIAEACALGRTLGPGAAFLAGGTELLPDFQRGRESARHLIALNRIAELRGIRQAEDGLHIGALTTLAEI